MAEIDASEPHEHPAGAALSVGARPGPLLRDPARARDGLPGIEPERTTTDWGRSERLTALADGTVHAFLYHYWFRVEVEGIANVPADGPALLVSNHAGRFAVDGAMIGRAVREQLPTSRFVHLATPHTYAGLPGLGMALTKLGIVSDHPANIHRLLSDERELVLVFPEGDWAAGKPLGWRYRLRRFDALAFVETALRARAPIVPVAVLGAEEATPSLAAPAALGGRLRLPIAAALPLPAKFRVRFLQPVQTGDLGEDPWRDPALVDGLREQIRALIQENLLELVAQRRSVWLG